MITLVTILMQYNTQHEVGSNNKIEGLKYLGVNYEIGVFITRGACNPHRC